MAEESGEIDINYLANLARIALTEEEGQELQVRLKEVLNFCEKLKAVDVSGVEAMAHAFPMFNVWQEDEPEAPFTVEQALMNAPQKSNDQLVVPKVVE